MQCTLYINGPANWCKLLLRGVIVYIVALVQTITNVETNNKLLNNCAQLSTVLLSSHAWMVPGDTVGHAP